MKRSDMSRLAVLFLVLMAGEMGVNGYQRVGASVMDRKLSLMQNQLTALQKGMETMFHPQAPENTDLTVFGQPKLRLLADGDRLWSGYDDSAEDVSPWVYPGEEGNTDEFGYVQSAQEEDAHRAMVENEYAANSEHIDHDKNMPEYDDSVHQVNLGEGAEYQQEQQEEVLDLKNKRDEWESRQVMARLGVPEDGVWHKKYKKSGDWFSSYMYFKRDKAGFWHWNTKKSMTRGWTLCTANDSYITRSYPALIRSLIKDLGRIKPDPIASVDVLEVLGRPSNGIYTYDAGMFVTELYFKYSHTTSRWSWSPDKRNWMPTSTHVVAGGRWRGQKPVQENRDIIDALEVYATTGEAQLPQHWGESWVTKAVRLAWRKFNTHVLDRLARLARQIVDLKNKIARIKIGNSDFGTLVSTMARVGRKAVVALMFGFFNGFMMGLGDQLRDAINDPACGFDENVQAVKGAFITLGKAMVSFMLSPLSVHTVVARFKALVNAITGFFQALFNIVWKCPPLKKVLGPLLIMIGIGLILNAIFVATGYGAIFKVVMALVGIIFAIPFLVRSSMKFVSGVKDIVVGTGMEKEDGMVKAIEGYAQIGGCLLAVFIMAKEIQKQGPQAIKEAMKTKVGQKVLGKFGIKPETASKDFAKGMEGMRKVKAGDKDAIKDLAPDAPDKPSTSSSSSSSTTKPVTTGNGQGGVVFDKSAGRFRDTTTGQFVKNPPSAQGMKWDVASQRWRDTSTGRYVKAPIYEPPMIKFNPKTGRWYNTQNGQFVKNPPSAKGLKWDVASQRFRDTTTGRYVKKPAYDGAWPSTSTAGGKPIIVPKTTGSNPIVFDKSVGRFRNTANGQFVKNPPSAAGMKWDVASQRWRDIASGRYVKAPIYEPPMIKFNFKAGRWYNTQNGQFVKNPPSAQGMRWDVASQRFRDIASGRYVKKPAYDGPWPVTAVTNTANTAATTSSTTSTVAAAAANTGNTASTATTIAGTAGTIASTGARTDTIVRVATALNNRGGDDNGNTNTDGGNPDVIPDDQGNNSGGNPDVIPDDQGNNSGGNPDVIPDDGSGQGVGSNDWQPADKGPEEAAENTPSGTTGDNGTGGQQSQGQQQPAGGESQQSASNNDWQPAGSGPEEAAENTPSGRETETSTQTAQQSNPDWQPTQQAEQEAAKDAIPDTSADQKADPNAAKKAKVREALTNIRATLATQESHLAAVRASTTLSPEKKQFYTDRFTTQIAKLKHTIARAENYLRNL